MYPRGSEWRRWDLHIHTPETIFEDQYKGDWNSFFAAVEAQKEVVAVGITDYMSISNYSKVKKARIDGRIRNITLLVPNIEFRIAPQTSDGHAINIHLLVSPDDAGHEDLILQSLGRLYWEYGANNYSCLPSQLMALGRSHDTNATSDTSALRAGAKQFKIDFSHFKKWYDAEPWLKRNSIVVVAAGEDGLSGLSKDSGWAATRDEISRFAGMIFSGSPRDKEFWMGARGKENREEVARLGGPKACIHGSDAHSLDRLFRPELDRFCWIKADLTFEGLRQLMFEPEDRVHIDVTAPDYHDRARVLSAVTIRGSNGWFEETALPLNPNLVSVIGPKGSGKSALADLISFAAGGFPEDDPSSFLNRAREHLKKVKITLEWSDGRSAEIALEEDQPTSCDVKYLSQSFVERLCSQDYAGDELVREIESVIFSHLDPTDTLNASDFSELRAMRTENTRRQREEVRTLMEHLIREDEALRANRLTMPEKRLRLAALEKEREALQKQIPPAQNAEEAKIQDELQKRRMELSALQSASGKDKQLIVKIDSARSRVASFSKDIDRFNAELRAALVDIGFSAADAAQYKAELRGNINDALLTHASAINAQIAAREGVPENPAAGTIAGAIREISSLESKATADQTRRMRLQTIQRRISAIETESARINQEIASIEGPEKDRIAAVKQERMDTYLQFFSSLKEEQGILEGLYQPVEERLESGSEQEQSLEFSIRWEVELSKWLERGLALFDQRKALPLSDAGGLEAVAKAKLVPGWTTGNVDQIRSGMDEFIEALNKAKPTASLRNSASLGNLLTWVFDVEHIQLRYALRYNGVELEKLSPGIKGIVLLILYLGMDRDDTRPLIIDQPEENLDNESIYNLLAGYFRRAKKQRQVILITHNPNLVVNTDSEQIVVAQATRRGGGLPAIKYTSGSLENAAPTQPGIRQHVCRILEGGEIAFQRRERRYSLTSNESR